MTYERVVAMLKRDNPGLDDDEVRELARDRMQDWAEEQEQIEDSPSIEDRMPEEALALRNEARIADRVDGYDRDDIGESPDY